MNQSVDSFRRLAKLAATMDSNLDSHSIPKSYCKSNQKADIPMARREANNKDEALAEAPLAPALHPKVGR